MKLAISLNCWGFAKRLYHRETKCVCFRLRGGLREQGRGCSTGWKEKSDLWGNKMEWFRLSQGDLTPLCASLVNAWVTHAKSLSSLAFSGLQSQPPQRKLSLTCEARIQFLIQGKINWKCHFNIHLPSTRNCFCKRKRHGGLSTIT